MTWKQELRARAAQIFVGARVRADARRVRARSTGEVLRGRVFVALHMHAGDGNVHTNIPVNSDNYAMLQAANAAVARIMALARSLDGVISGEHGIGITKLEYPDRRRARASSAATSSASIRRAASTAQAAAAAAICGDAYTPSFGLMGHESLIMQQSDIGAHLRRDQGLPALRQVQAGVRDPRAARQSAVLAARQDPRDLAADRGVSVRGADAARRLDQALGRVRRTSPTIARCATNALTPCPVDIDFGDVSMSMRDLLRRMGKKRFNPGTAASMFFLNATNPQTIKIARKVMIDWGYKAQRLAQPTRCRRSPTKQTKRPPATTGKAAGAASRSSTSSTSGCRAACRRRTARALLDIEDRNYVPIIRDPQATSSDSEAVFYFPGCGSERLFSQVGLATQAMLWHVGVQTVLPPGYLCCGYPQRGAGEFDKAEKIITDNRVLFHRVANTLELSRHQDRGGELRHLLRPVAGLRIRQDIPRLPDHRHPRIPAGEGRAARQASTGTRYMYHDPCHIADEEAGPAQASSTR